MARLGEDRSPRWRQVCQEPWFERPYPIALRGDVHLCNRQESEKWLRLLIPGKGDQSTRGKRHGQRGCKADTSFRIRAKVYCMRDRDRVLIAINQRKLHLVPHQGDVEVIALGVLHVMIRLATVEQREDHKRGRGGDSPRQPVMRVSALPRAINGDLLTGQVGKQHRTTMDSGAWLSMGSYTGIISDRRPSVLTVAVGHAHRRAVENGDSTPLPRDSHRDRRNSPHTHPSLFPQQG
jgi:hypothetical protein